MRVYRQTLILSILVILVCYIMKLFGYSGFNIPIIDSALNNNLLSQTICYILLYTINGLLIIIIIVKDKLTRKQIIIFILIELLFCIVSLVINDFFKIILEILILLIYANLISKNKLISLEVILIYGINIVYQMISMYTRGLIINVTKESFTTNFILNIDYYIFMIISLLYFLKKGEYLYEIIYKLIKQVKWRPLAFLGFIPKRESEEKCLQQNEKNIQEINIELGYFLFNILLFLFQFLLVLTLCYFIKKTILNILIIYISFVVLRTVFGKSYHADTIIKCTTLGAVIFMTATELSLDINISLLSSVIIGVLIAYLMHIYYYYDSYIKCNNDLTKMSFDELKIKLYYLTELEVSLVYDYWHKYKNVSADDIAEKYGYNKMKIYRTIKKIKNNNL